MPSSKKRRCRSQMSTSSFIDNNGPLCKRSEEEYEVGDYVFTKIKGHSIWPSMVTGVEEAKPTTSSRLPTKHYEVFFFGTNEKARVVAESLYPYFDHREQFGFPKTSRVFNKALFEIEKHIRENVASDEAREVEMSQDGQDKTSNDGGLAMDPKLEKSVNHEEPISSVEFEDVRISSGPDGSNDEHIAHFVAANQPNMRTHAMVIESVKSLIKYEIELSNYLKSDDCSEVVVRNLLNRISKDYASSRRLPMLLRPSLLVLLLALRKDLLTKSVAEVDTGRNEGISCAWEVNEALIYRYLSHVYRANDLERWPKSMPLLRALLKNTEVWRERFRDSCKSALKDPKNREFAELYDDLPFYFSWSF